jgi:hypothetical protein
MFIALTRFKWYPNAMKLELRGKLNLKYSCVIGSNFLRCFFRLERPILLFED